MGTNRPARVRFFLHVEPPGWVGAPTPLMDLSHALLAEIRRHVDVRALPQAGANMGREHPRWEPMADDFHRPVAENYVNVICGTPKNVAACWTGGRLNVGVLHGDVDVLPTETELVVLRRFDEGAVAVAGGDSCAAYAAALRHLGLTVIVADVMQLARTISALAHGEF